MLPLTTGCAKPTGADPARMREQMLRFGDEVVAPIHKKYPPIEHPAIPAACRW